MTRTEEEEECESDNDFQSRQKGDGICVGFKAEEWNQHRQNEALKKFNPPIPNEDELEIIFRMRSKPDDRDIIFKKMFNNMWCGQMVGAKKPRALKSWLSMAWDEEYECANYWDPLWEDCSCLDVCDCPNWNTLSEVEQEFWWTVWRGNNADAIRRNEKKRKADSDTSWCKKMKFDAGGTHWCIQSTSPGTLKLKLIKCPL